MSTSITITVKSADATGFTVETAWPLNQSVNKVALRTLVMNMAAMHRGITLRELWAEGYDRNLDVGWTLTPGPAASGRKTYSARPLSRTERAQQLHDHGGAIRNEDGSMSFWLPGEYPAPVVVPIKVRQRRR